MHIMLRAAARRERGGGTRRFAAKSRREELWSVQQHLTGDARLEFLRNSPERREH